MKCFKKAKAEFVDLSSASNMHDVISASFSWAKQVKARLAQVQKEEK